MLADKLPSARSSFVLIGLLAALGQCVTWVLGAVTQMNWFEGSSGWWHTASFLASVITRTQCVALLTWSVTTGLLVAAGARGRLQSVRLPLAAFFAGALVPMGLTLLRSALSLGFPGMNELRGVPLMTVLLIAYAVMAPWLLGRLITRAAAARPTSRPAAERKPAEFSER